MAPSWRDADITEMRGPLKLGTWEFGGDMYYNTDLGRGQNTDESDHGHAECTGWGDSGYPSQRGRHPSWELGVKAGLETQQPALSGARSVKIHTRVYIAILLLKEFTRKQELASLLMVGTRCTVLGKKVIIISRVPNFEMWSIPHLPRDLWGLKAAMQR